MSKLGIVLCLLPVVFFVALLGLAIWDQEHHLYLPCWHVFPPATERPEPFGGALVSNYEDAWLSLETPAYYEGFIQAEQDVEDGASAFGVLLIARRLLSRSDISRAERDRLRGRMR
jgi:hypothetical protein